MNRRQTLAFSTSPILEAIPDSFLEADVEDPFTIIFWARSSAVKDPQMFVVEGQGEPIWKAFYENILGVANIEASLVSCFDKYLETDEKLQVHASGRLTFGKAATGAGGMNQWITISNRPGHKIDLDEHGAPIH